MLAAALVSTGAFAQKVTIDLTDNTKWAFPTEAYAKEAKSFTDGTYTLKLEAASSGYKFKDGVLIIGKKNATVELPAFDFDVERIEVVGYANASGKVTQNIFAGDQAVSSPSTGAKGTSRFDIAADHQAKNTVYTLKVTNENNTQITKIMVWEKGTAPVITVPVAGSIAEFKAMAVGTKAVLKLTNAKVQYATSDDVYVADATGGIDLFKTGLAFKAGQTLNGTITGTYAEYANLPELTNVEENKLTTTDGTVEPVEMTVEEAVKAENYCKLVTIKNVTLTAVSNKYYSGTDKLLQFYDKYKLGYDVTVTEPRQFTGIIIPYNKQIEMFVTQMPTATGINNVDAGKTAEGKKYNINGQLVGKDFKGIYIMNGKKHLNK